ncbi:nucleoside recognition domain-containing protein [Geomicrobium sp. JCM 19039]|uniref:nucleoside recognition domain-containing protein n=1 Tax=Geomicrobium sp. JCM 19039 TaxID=1460636 RepID=UPI00045F1DAC|nr:nucleoside recognition domain-containing protein [Geomicrobium sp. JCM 19039]GAK14666.1 nucleoside binding-domain containing protein [Geomicrobium sp. JCM 19039]
MSRAKIDVKKGLGKGLHSTWKLGRIIFPITTLIVILRHTPVIDQLSQLLAPFTRLFGLPGEAAIAFVLGNLQLYAGIGSILAMDLTMKEVFILAVMLSFSHNLILESAFLKEIRVSIWLVVTVRLGMAMLFGMLVNLLYPAGGEEAAYTVVEPAMNQDAWGSIVLEAVGAGVGAVLQLAMIVIPLMVVIQAIYDLSLLDFFTRWMKPCLQPLGISQRGAIVIGSGMIFGLIYGASVIIQEAKEQNFSERELTLLILYLAICHAVIEDTMIFLPLGVNVLWLLLFRFVGAVVLLLIVAWLWKRTVKKSLSTEQQAV